MAPPSVLLGADPSMKDNEKVYGVDVSTGEAELRAALCPPGMTENVAKGLTNAMIDVAALPGGFASGGVEEANDSELTFIGAALEEMAHQGRGGTVESVGRSDLQWRSQRKTTIRTIKDEKTLRKRCKTLMKLRDKVVSRMGKASISACRRSGWTDENRMEAWGYGGYMIRITLASFDYYVSLHNHWLELISIDEADFSYVAMEIDHHAEELEVIRDTSEYRLQCLCLIYSYLRDNHGSGWFSAALQSKRNMELLKGTGSVISDMSGGACIKCGTTLHTGGKQECPWKNAKDGDARRKGQEALRKLAGGWKKLKKDEGDDDDP